MLSDPVRAMLLKARESGQRSALDTVFKSIVRALADAFAPGVQKAQPLAPSADADLHSDPHQALLLAQIDHRVRCLESGADPDPGDRALRALWDDPEGLSHVLAPHAADEPAVQKAIAYGATYLKAAQKAPKGGITLTNADGIATFYPGGQWIPSSAVDGAKPEEKQELAERTAGARPNPLSKREVQQQATAARRGTTAERRKKVADLATDIMLRPGTRTPEKYRELAASLDGDHLTVADLRALRTKLSASFGGGRRKEQMVAALLAHAEGAARDLENPVPDEPPPERKPRAPRAPEPGTFAVLNTDALSVDPVRFQFKQKVNAEGVTKELQGVSTFDPDFAGVIAVWHEPATGKTWVVNGHHRFELARRTGHRHLAVRYLNCATAEEARARGALINIAEGRGTALDAAKFLRDVGRGPEDLYKHGISPDGALMRDADALSKLNPAAFKRLAVGTLDPRTAIAVATHLTDPDRQEKLFKLIASREDGGREFTGRHLEELARQMAAAPSMQTTLSTLWGDETSEDDAFLERAELASHLRATLGKERNDFSALASKRRADVTADAGNKLNLKENAKRAAEAEAHQNLFDTLAHRRGPVADLLDQAAIQIKGAKTKAERERIRDHALTNVRAALSDVLAGRTPATGSGGAVGELGGGGGGGGGGERPAGAAGAAADRGADAPQPNGVSRGSFFSPANKTWQPPAGGTAPPWIPGAPAHSPSPPNELTPQKLAQQSLPREWLRENGYQAVGKHSDLRGDGYQIVRWHNIKTGDTVLEYQPNQISAGPVDRGSHTSPKMVPDTTKPRFTARTGDEVAAVHAAIGAAPPGPPREIDRTRVDPETGSVLNRRGGGKHTQAEIRAMADEHARTVPHIADVKRADPDAVIAEQIGGSVRFPHPDDRAKLDAAGVPNEDTVDQFADHVDALERAGHRVRLVESPRHAAGNAQDMLDAAAGRSVRGYPTGADLKRLQDAIARTNKKVDPAALQQAAVGRAAKLPGGEIHRSTDDGVTTTIVPSTGRPGGFNVVHRDDDSGETIGVTTYPTEDRARAAVAKYREQVKRSGEPPLARGMVRLYHGGLDANAGGGRWVTGSREYAEGWARKGGADVPVHYVDVPADHPQVKEQLDALEASTGTRDARHIGSFELDDQNSRRLKPLGTAEPPAPDLHPNATADHTPAIDAIPPGDSAFVAGHRVRRLKDGSFQMEHGGKFVYYPSARPVAMNISGNWAKQSGFPSVPSALARAKGYTEPDPFLDAAASAEDAKMRSAVPDGTRAVSMDPDTYGRLGKVRRDPETGQAKLHFDGEEETRATDFEPLDPAHSWRAAAAERESRRPKGSKTGDLFGGATESAPRSIKIGPPRAPRGLGDANHILGEVRDLRHLTDDHDALLAQVDAVGRWAAANKTTRGTQKLLTEAHQLADQLRGGSGKAGVRVQPVDPQWAEIEQQNAEFRKRKAEEAAQQPSAPNEEPAPALFSNEKENLFSREPEQEKLLYTPDEIPDHHLVGPSYRGSDGLAQALEDVKKYPGGKVLATGGMGYQVAVPPKPMGAADANPTEDEFAAASAPYVPPKPAHEQTQAEYVESKLASHPDYQNALRNTPGNAWAVRDRHSPGLKSDHEIAVANAISAGQTVPESVLRDYPLQRKRAAAQAAGALAPAEQIPDTALTHPPAPPRPAEKQPHEMTLAEFRKSRFAPRFDPAVHDDSIDLAKLQHINAVGEAARNGLPIPTKVLNEYPGLVKPRPATVAPAPAPAPEPAPPGPAEATATATLAAKPQQPPNPEYERRALRAVESAQYTSVTQVDQRLAKAAADLDAYREFGNKFHAGCVEAEIRLLTAKRRELEENAPAAPAPVVAPPPAAAPKPSSPNVMPHVALSHTVGDKLATGALGKNELWEHADRHFGGTRAEGAYGPSDAYDALEAGFNRSLAGATDPTAPLADAQRQARELKAKVDALPTQTNRSGNKETFQQFSTPPHYAFAANWVANLTPGENVLEPSAGTGDLAVHAKNAGAEVHVNELDPRRADFLKDQFGADRTHTENAEQIGGILPKRGVPQPTTVVMNPPFSQTAGRMGDKKELLTGARHIQEAGKMLAPGGRLVAIVGRGMTPDAKTYREWFRDMAQQGMTLRANVGVGGDEYKKYGTSFDTRMLVFDKVKPDGSKPVVGDAKDVPELMEMLEGVRNDRSKLAGAAPDQRAGGGLPAQAGGGTEPGAAAGADAGPGVAPAGAGGGAALAEVPAGAKGPRRVARGRRPAVGDVPAGAGLRDDARPDVDDVPEGSQVAPVGTPAGAGAGPAAEADGAQRGKGAGGKPVLEPAPSVPGLRKPERVTVEAIEAKPGEASEPNKAGESMYETYRPARMRVPGAVPHTNKLVESAAMAAVAPPVPTYRPTLPPEVVTNEVRDVKGLDGKVRKKPIGLSEAGLETVVYTGQAHQTFLDAATGDEAKHDALYTAPGGIQYRAKKLAGERWMLEPVGHTGPAESFDSPLEMSQHMDGWRKPSGDVFRAAPESFRRGFLCGDGTGTGKGRQIGGVILDNKSQGRPKHVWVSEKDELMQDAKRDWADLGQNPDDVVSFDQLQKGGFKHPSGIAFATYDKLKSGPRDPKEPRNVDRLIDWLGKDFDGVIAFDEAHNMGNADDTEGSRGVVKASQKALAALKIMKALPKARVMLVSATGATELDNLSYMDRLGLWGRGTPFENKAEFLKEMGEGGTAAMEAISQSLKARGLYVARSLSYDGVKTDRLQHKLSDEQRYVYDNLAEGWQKVLENIDKAVESLAGGKENMRHAGMVMGSAKAQFQAAQQRFFNQIITSMAVPTLIKGIEKDLAEGRAPVVQLVNTMESALTKALSSHEGDDYSDIDLSPRQMLIGYLEKSFPVHRMEQYTDENDNVRMRVVKDAAGNPVEDPAAVAMRDELIARAHDLRMPESPLDQIINHFGHENVAEVTGRSERLVNKFDESGQLALTRERRDPKRAKASEAAAFQAGKKKILVFSAAGGTGVSYHADKNAANQAQRSHYLLQPGWRADAAVQGLGRTHRTNQSSAPVFHLMEVPEIPGQKRFVSTIARRLSQLGALTRGQAQTGGGVDLFNAADNMESPQAQAGLESFINELKRGGAVNGTGYGDFMKRLGFKIDEDSAGGGWGRVKGQTEVPGMSQFLNRVLALKLDDQRAVFERLDEAIADQVDMARANGTLDNGVERFEADKIEPVGKPQVAYRDPGTGAEARIIETRATRKRDKLSWNNAHRAMPVKYVKNNQSGKVWAVHQGTAITDARTGEIVPQYRLLGVTGKQHVPQRDVDTKGYYGSKYTELTPEDARREWEQQFASAPDTTTTAEHFVSGDLLAVWDKLPRQRPKIYRVNMSDGTSLVGRHIPAALVDDVRKKLGVAAGAKKAPDPAEAHAAVLQGQTATLANGWKLKYSRVQGEPRIELTGPIGLHKAGLRQDGAIVEKIASQDRYFIPTGGDGVRVLERIIAGRNSPVTEVR